MIADNGETATRYVAGLRVDGDTSTVVDTGWQDAPGHPTHRFAEKPAQVPSRCSASIRLWRVEQRADCRKFDF